MAANYSKEAFFGFLDYLSDRDLIKYQTLRGWRSAASKLLSDLSNAEESDIRTVDIELAVHRAANRDQGSVSSQSLKTYQQRITTAIQEFIEWRTDPVGYQARASRQANRTKRSGEGAHSPDRIKVTNVTSSDKHDREIPSSHSGLTLSYPLRSDFLAQVVIPRDLNIAEAKRLGAFLLTIAVDYQPE